MLCVRKFPLAKILKIREGECQGFPAKRFCLTVPKSFAGETFCAVFQIVSGSEKVYGYEKVDIKIFRKFFFVSQCGKSSFRRGILKCFINFGYRRSVWIRDGGNQDFPSNFFISECRKLP